MTLYEFITAQAARLKQAGVSFGHGTTNAFDEAAWLVLWALSMDLAALEEHARRELSAQEIAKAEDLVSERISSRRYWCSLSLRRILLMTTPAPSILVPLSCWKRRMARRVRSVPATEKREGSATERMRLATS